MSFPEKLDEIAAYIDGAIRVLYNAEKGDFLKIFGEEKGPYLWERFAHDKNSNEGEFICYLDHQNQRLLAAAVLEYAAENDERLTKGEKANADQ